MPLEIDNEFRSLLLGVSQGDETAFTNLFDLFRPNIYTTALRITRDEILSQEIVQDTFVKVWIGRAGLSKVENFNAWIYTVARNVTYTALKKDKKERENFEQLSRDSIGLFYPEADYKLQEKEFEKILSRAIDRLPNKQRETYRLIKEEGIKRNDAAMQLDVSPETVKWNLEQAMRSIRAYCLTHINEVPLILILHFLSRYF